MVLVQAARFTEINSPNRSNNLIHASRPHAKHFVLRMTTRDGVVPKFAPTSKLKLKRFECIFHGGLPELDIKDGKHPVRIQLR
jgi:hypothetical protein